MENPKQHFDVYAMINDLIIKKLEEGVIPWKQPWTKAGLPQNIVTQRPYTGVNTWLLNAMGFEKNYFLTFKQIQELGGSVTKGSKSIPVIFWKREEKEDPQTNELKKVTLLRYYSVFNISQCENISFQFQDIDSESEPDPIPICDKIILGMPELPKIVNKGYEAYYDPVMDFINMPFKKTFKNAIGYYSTLFHELIHSTGHSKRLGRKEIVEPDKFGTEVYSQEELVAEIGACYLKSYSGIAENIDNNVAYIQNWLNALKNDKRLIIHASAKAQRAVDYILKTPTN